MSNGAKGRFSKTAKLAVGAAGVVAATVAVAAVLWPSDPSSSPDPLLGRVDGILAELPLGNVAFNTPRTLRVDRRAEIQVLLSGVQSIPALRKQIKELGETEGAVIKVSDVMEASLTGLGFEIQPITPARQLVGGEGVTEWRWQVDPGEPGQQQLFLSISAVIDYNGNQSPRTVRTFERTLNVTNIPGDPGRSLNEFLSENWQWLISTLVIPLGLWLLHRRRKPARDVPRDAGSTT